MVRTAILVGAFAMVCVMYVTQVSASREVDEFCAGYEQGFKSVRGNRAYVGLCPIVNTYSLTYTPFQQGIRKGVEFALATEDREKWRWLLEQNSIRNKSN